MFETLLVVDNYPIELDAHMARLADSVRTVYGEDPPDTRDMILSRARGGELGRLRVTVAPRARGGFSVNVVVAQVDPLDVFPSAEFASSLATMIVDRGLGEHKWADRALLERAEAIGPAGAVALLVTEDGIVLEASRASVFAVQDGKLITPPLDGSILPGVARARVIEVAEESGVDVVEEPLQLSELLGAEEVFLTGSVRGVEPVGATDGEALPRDGRVTATLAAGLRERWFPSLAAL